MAPGALDVRLLGPVEVRADGRRIPLGGTRQGALIALLLITIPIALWIAARLYRSGVLMYGQSPTPRTLWRALRAS